MDFINQILLRIDNDVDIYGVKFYKITIYKILKTYLWFQINNIFVCKQKGKSTDRENLQVLR